MFIHSPVDEHFGYSHLHLLQRKEICLYKVLIAKCLVFTEQTSWSRMGGSHGRYMFNTFQKTANVFYSGCIILLLSSSV